jgi:hypothetical protein
MEIVFVIDSQEKRLQVTCLLSYLHLSPGSLMDVLLSVFARWYTVLAHVGETPQEGGKLQ